MKVTITLLLSFLSFLILTLALLELSLPFLNNRYSAYFRQGIAPASLKAEEARRFVSSKTFDPELGWDKDPIARNYVGGKRYFAQSYGDSFVEGVEVGPDHTWQAQFERLTGEAILNLGVGGYGLDQAVLKFEKYGRGYPTRLAVLGLYAQTYRRALSYYPFYYFANSDAYTFAFKPIFVKRDGRFELIRPPCADAACLMEVLSNPGHPIWRLVSTHDYWYQSNQKKPTTGFPMTIKYAQVLPQILRERREQRGVENYFFVNAESFELVEYLIERFVKYSREIGMTPVCLLLYAPTDLRIIKAGIRLDDKLLVLLKKRNIPHIDTAPYILGQYRQDDDFMGLSAPKGHLNERGNQLVAESLVQGFSINRSTWALKNASAFLSPPVFTVGRVE
jgi:hypothetical protein